MPILLVVAGPNGCGKSSLTRTTWFGDVDIIDPDVIASGVMASSPGQAAREALRRRQAALAKGQTHWVETTLAGSGILRHMTAARRAGYHIALHYVSVASPDQAPDRIRNRVGGARWPRCPGSRRREPLHGHTEHRHHLRRGDRPGPSTPAGMPPKTMTEREVFWPPDWIMLEAMSLRDLAERLYTDRVSHPRVGKPTTAAPVLLALATELSLKAWQCRERNGKPPDKTHDLTKLFDALGDGARSLLEHAMPAHPDPLIRSIPVHSGVREALNVNRNLFETWRYPYEHLGLIAETGTLKTAFAAIVVTYWRFIPPNKPVPSTVGPVGSGPKQTLGNSRRHQR